MRQYAQIVRGSQNKGLIGALSYAHAQDGSLRYIITMPTGRKIKLRSKNSFVVFKGKNRDLAESKFKYAQRNQPLVNMSLAEYIYGGTD